MHRRREYLHVVVVHTGSQRDMRGRNHSPRRERSTSALDELSVLEVAAGRERAHVLGYFTRLLTSLFAFSFKVDRKVVYDFGEQIGSSDTELFNHNGAKLRVLVGPA